MSIRCVLGHERPHDEACLQCATAYQVQELAKLAPPAQTECRECHGQTGGGAYCYRHAPYQVWPKADGSFLVDRHGTKRVSFEEPPTPTDAAPPAPEAAPPQPELGLNVDMVDVDRLRDWARNLLVHGADVSHWASVTHLVSRMQILATALEKEIRDVGELRKLAALAAPRPDRTPADREPIAENAKEHDTCPPSDKDAI